jgi:hypothetical protein
MHTSEGLSIEQVVCIGATTPFFVSWSRSRQNFQV